jgi:hypothetical protein
MISINTIYIYIFRLISRVDTGDFVAPEAMNEVNKGFNLKLERYLL